MLREKPNKSMPPKKGSLIVILLLGIIITFITSSSTTGKNNDASKIRLHATQSSNLKSQTPDTLPLLSIMTKLESDVNMISAGIWRHDFQMIKKGAKSIAHHPKIPSRQVKLIKAILGPDQFKDFVKTDQLVHQKATEITKKADKQKLDVTTELFLEMKRGCISCHVDHRNKIVSSDTW